MNVDDLRELGGMAAKLESTIQKLPAVKRDELLRDIPAPSADSPYSARSLANALGCSRACSLVRIPARHLRLGRSSQ